MTDPLPVTSSLGGVFWTWIVPIALFSITAIATWMLYRHFSGERPGRGRK